ARGGLDETTSMPSGRAVRPEAASSVAPVVIHYRDSLRPCLGTAIAPRRRARFRQTLLAPRQRVQQRGGGDRRRAHGDREWGRCRFAAIAKTVRETPASSESRTPSDATAAPTCTTGAKPSSEPER